LETGYYFTYFATCTFTVDDVISSKDVREPASCYYAGFTQDGTPIGITVKHHGIQNGA